MRRRESRSPDDVAAELSDEEILKGPMGPLFQGLKVQMLLPAKKGHSLFAMSPLCCAAELDHESARWQFTLFVHYAKGCLPAWTWRSNFPSTLLLKMLRGGAS